LGLATRAALCPPDWQVEIVDENIEPVPLESAQISAAFAAWRAVSAREGIARSLPHARPLHPGGGQLCFTAPGALRSLADTVVAGEAEYIYTQFCRDFERGEPKALYHETETVALTDSPTPRFDLLKLDRYVYAASACAGPSSWTTT